MRGRVRRTRRRSRGEDSLPRPRQLPRVCTPLPSFGPHRHAGRAGRTAAGALFSTSSRSLPGGRHARSRVLSHGSPYILSIEHGSTFHTSPSPRAHTATAVVETCLLCRRSGVWIAPRARPCLRGTGASLGGSILQYLIFNHDMWPRAKMNRAELSLSPAGAPTPSALAHARRTRHNRRSPPGTPACQSRPPPAPHTAP